VLPPPCFCGVLQSSRQRPLGKLRYYQGILDIYNPAFIFKLAPTPLDHSYCVRTQLQQQSGCIPILIPVPIRILIPIPIAPPIRIHLCIHPHLVRRSGSCIPARHSTCLPIDLGA
jgi:hypothetical protein